MVNQVSLANVSCQQVIDSYAEMFSFQVVYLAYVVYQAIQVIQTSVHFFSKQMFHLVTGVNGLPGQAGLQGSKGERGMFMMLLQKFINIDMSLGGTAPGFWGDVGLPGARGRAGGKLLTYLTYR